MAKMLPLRVSLELCHELLEICEPSDPEKESGLKWKVNRRGTAKAGNWAGSLIKKVRSSGQIREDWQVGIDGKLYLAARIIYFMEHGVDPYPLEVDHINRDSRDNWVDNLRLAKKPKLQGQNKGIRKNNKSGITGVHEHKNGKWQAYIKKNNKQIFLGYFTTRKEAAAARNEGVRKYFLEETQEANLVDLESITD